MFVRLSEANFPEMLALRPAGTKLLVYIHKAVRSYIRNKNEMLAEEHIPNIPQKQVLRIMTIF